jgi:hypothetical protein
MREEDHPKRKILNEVKHVGLVPVVASSTTDIRFLELASRTSVSPKGLSPCGSHVVFTWNTFGAGQVCAPAHPDRGQHHVRNRPLKSKMR